MNRMFQNEELAFYESIVNSSNDAIIGLSLDGKITAWNNSAELLFDYMYDEIIGKQITILIPGEKIHEEALILNRIKAGEHIKHYETTRLKKDGTHIYISLTVSPIINIDGIVIGASKIARDISERKKSEMLLKMSELNYKRVVENIIEGLVINDLNGKIIFVNNQFLKLFGITRDELENIDLKKFIQPGHFELLLNRSKRRIAGEDIPNDFEFICIRKDGEKRWMELRVSKIIEENKLVGIQSTLRDITEKKDTEEKIKKSLKEVEDYKYALYQSFVVAITDTNGIIKYVNDIFCKFSKYSKEELIGQTHNIVNSGYHTKEFFKELWDTITAGKVWKGEIKNKNKEGKCGWLDAVIVPFLDKDMKPYQYLSIRYDITEKKEIEEKLIESEKIYKTITAHLPGAVITIINKNREIIFAEGEGIHKLGLNKTEIIHSNLIKGLPDSFNNNIISFRERAFNGEKVSEILKVKNTYFQTDYFPLKNDTGEIYAVMSINIDITNIKNEEFLRHKTEANLKAIFDHTDICYLLLDLNKNIVSLNKPMNTFATEHFGIKVEIGQNALEMFESVKDFISSQQQTELINAINTTLLGIDVNYELNFNAINENIKWYNARFHPVINEENCTIGAIISLRDITIRKNLELEETKIKEDLILRNHDLEQFAYIVSHNLRAPVASILGLTSLLTDGIVPATDMLEIINGIQETSYKLDEVIKDINNIISLNKDIAEKRELINFPNLINDIVFTINNNFNYIKFTVITNFEQNETINSIRSYFHSIFYNLISNSIKYCKLNIEPIIEITSTKNDNYVFIVFKDNGIGINLNKNGRKIFGLYNRFHNHVEGKGMGLFMVKKQIELLGGYIEINSEENVGTQFKLCFPIN